MRRDLAGLRVIVTGASSGIGYALAEQLVESGANVVALARRKERLQQLAAALPAAAVDRFRWIAGDVTDAALRRQAIELCEQTWGGLDALVNNAGIGGHGSFAAADEARLRKIMEVNFFAPAEFIRQALPALRRGRTPIVVNVGSVLGHRAVPGKSEYSASKFAMHGLSDALRIELGREGIDLLLVSPSTTASEFFDVAMPTTADGGAESEKMRRERTFGAMTPEKVAQRIVTAMRKGKREIILSPGGKALVWFDRLCPPLMDWVLRKFG